MLRFATALLLPAMLVLTVPEVTAAQRPGSPGYDIAGVYENVSGGGTCHVHNRGRTYLFVNERGSQAEFAFTGPGQLSMVWGEWDPGVTVTVGRDPYGRTQLRFDTPNKPTGYWVKTS